MNQNKNTSMRPILLGVMLLAAPAAMQAQYEYTTNSDGISLTITGYTGSGGVVTIPTNIHGLAVTSIGTGALSSLTNLTSVTIPGSLGVNEFLGVFDDGPTLTNVTVANGVTSIAIGLFQGMTSLTGITLPASVTNIGEYAFYDCSSLTSLTIPAGVTYIGEYAFEACSSLRNSLTIPASVTYIGKDAFYDGYGLTNFFFAGNAPAFVSPVFNGTNLTVYYLPGATGWSNTFAGAPTVLWNPLIQASAASFGAQSNPFGFNISGTANIPIVVEACANLANPAWTPLQTLTVTNGLCSFSDPQWTNFPARYYRLSAP
jgi:hypothetical protein